MYVTDTPVIDRLINPGPMDVVSAVERDMDDRLRNEEVALSAPLRALLLEHLGFVRDFLGPATLEEFDEAVGEFVELGAANECDLLIGALHDWSDELATRLAAIA